MRLRPTPFTPAGSYGIQRALTTQRRRWRRPALLALALVATWALTSCETSTTSDPMMPAAVGMLLLSVVIILMAMRAVYRADQQWWAAWRQREEDWSIARKRQKLRERREFTEDRAAPHDLPTFTESPTAQIPPAELHLIVDAMHTETHTALADIEKARHGVHSISNFTDLLDHAKSCLARVIDCQRRLLVHTRAERGAL